MTYSAQPHSGASAIPARCQYVSRAAGQRWGSGGGATPAEPTELDQSEAAGCWAEALMVARALLRVCRPLKLSYETLGNSLPHLHTHLVPRSREDPAPGR